jgi:uncharacterized membrane protein
MQGSLFPSIVISLAALGFVHAEPLHVMQTPNATITGMSHDTQFAVLVHPDPFAGTQAILWSRTSGSETVLPGFDNANAVNNAGTVVGTVADAKSQQDVPAFAELAESPHPIPLLAGMDSGDARAISDEGTVVGLNATLDGSDVRAFFWKIGQGTQLLPAQGNPSYATGISSDGSVIVGATVVEGTPRGTAWIGHQPIAITDAQGNPVGEAEAVSSNGKFVVGEGLLNAQGQTIAWRWNVQTHQLQPIARMWFANGVSDDGRTVVGDTGFQDNRVLVVWTQGSGTVTLRDYLDARGAIRPTGWSILAGTMNALSPDGSTIGGCCGLEPDSALHSFVIDDLAPQLDHLFDDGFDTPAQAVRDPGFEATSEIHGSNPSWTGSDSNPSANGGTPFTSVRNGDAVDTGFWSVLFGAWANGFAESQEFSQQVQLPSAGPAFVNFQRFAAKLPDVDAELTVRIDDHIVWSRDLSELSLVDPDLDFVPQSADIGVYADGGTHTLRFTYDYNGGDNDGFIYIDDVTIDSFARNAR